MDSQEFSLCCKILDYLVNNNRLLVFDENTKSLKAVESVSINGNDFQLNVEKWENNDDSAKHA